MTSFLHKLLMLINWTNREIRKQKRFKSTCSLKDFIADCILDVISLFRPKKYYSLCFTRHKSTYFLQTNKGEYVGLCLIDFMQRKHEPGKSRANSWPFIPNRSMVHQTGWPQLDTWCPAFFPYVTSFGHHWQLRINW